MVQTAYIAKIEDPDQTAPLGNMKSFLKYEW